MKKKDLKNKKGTKRERGVFLTQTPQEEIIEEVIARSYHYSPSGYMRQKIKSYY